MGRVGRRVSSARALGGLCYSKHVEGSGVFVDSQTDFWVLPTSSKCKHSYMGCWGQK